MTSGCRSRSPPDSQRPVQIRECDDSTNKVPCVPTQNTGPVKPPRIEIVSQRGRDKLPLQNLSCDTTLDFKDYTIGIYQNLKLNQVSTWNNHYYRQYLPNCKDTYLERKVNVMSECQGIYRSLIGHL